MVNKDQLQRSEGVGTVARRLDEILPPDDGTVAPADPADTVAATSTVADVAATVSEFLAWLEPAAATLAWLGLDKPAVAAVCAECKTESLPSPWKTAIAMGHRGALPIATLQVDELVPRIEQQVPFFIWTGIEQQVLLLFGQE